MASNLRAKPIEGHVTDSAGNVLRNSQIIVKQVNPSGSFPVDTVNSDDNGYFITKPVPSGQYDIYESGIIVAKTIHSSDKNSIQCFKAHSDNYNIENIGNFDTLASEGRLSNFELFIQIESSEIDTEQYGSIFPIYDFQISSETPVIIGDAERELWHLAQFFEFGVDSRITTTRFDIEYFSPLTALSNTYQRIRWAGVPAIRFSPDSKLVVPLDYFSIVPNLPRMISPEDSDFTVPGVSVTGSGNNISVASSVSTFKDAVDRMKVGDILKLIVEEVDEDPEIWYGVITSRTRPPYGSYTIALEKLRSSRFLSTDLSSGVFYVSRILTYDGMFKGIADINEEVNERFTVTENIYAQDDITELYNYNDRYIAP